MRNSAWNEHFSATRIDVGWPDPPLTSAGPRRRRAPRPSACARDGLRRLITSPYRRTLQTASILAAEPGPADQRRSARARALRLLLRPGQPPAELARDWPELDFTRLERALVGRRDRELAQPRRPLRRLSRRHRGLPDRDEVAVGQPLGLHPRPDRRRTAQYRIRSASPTTRPPDDLREHMTMADNPTAPTARARRRPPASRRRASAHPDAVRQGPVLRESARTATACSRASPAGDPDPGRRARGPAGRGPVTRS